MTSSSFTPARASFSPSRNTSSMGRLANNPRIEGMMQKLHLLLQPSEIFRYA